MAVTISPKPRLITKACPAAWLALVISPAPTKRDITALAPIVRPSTAERTMRTAMPATPTPAMEADPSRPTHIMSTVWPTVYRLPLIIIGQESVRRLPRILPLVQSRPNAAARSAERSASFMVAGHSFAGLRGQTDGFRLLNGPRRHE